MTNSMMDRLVQALLDGDQNRAIIAATQLRENGVENGKIIADGIEAAMACLDAKCTVQQFNLLEIMLCGRAVTGVMKKLYPSDAPVSQDKDTVVLGALEGDVHDLGKNIVKMVLSVSGYRVVDCGKNCPLESFIDSAKKERAVAIGISGLITTVVPQVRRVKNRLAEQGLGHIKVMAGGAALKQANAGSLNVDFVAQTAFDGLHYLNHLTKSGQ